MFANAVEDNPLWRGFHGVGEADVVINVGVSGPELVKRALEKVKENLLTWCETEKTAFKIARVGQLVGHIASDRLGVPLALLIYHWHQHQKSVILLPEFWKKLGWKLLELTALPLR